MALRLLRSPQTPHHAVGICRYTLEQKEYIIALIDTRIDTEKKSRKSNKK